MTATMKYLTLALMALATVASSTEVAADLSLSVSNENEASYQDEVAFGNRELSGKGKGKGKGKVSADEGLINCFRKTKICWLPFGASKWEAPSVRGGLFVILLSFGL